MNSIEFIHNIAKRREPDKFDWEQAKEMHRKEIIDAYVQGREDNHLDYYPQKHSEDYYNETYKK